MRKLIAISATVALCLVIGGGIVLYLSYRLPAPPARAYVPELGETTRIVVYENGSAAVHAESARDAYAGLGYLHAQEHSWTMNLWQRTARGNLSAWLGEELLVLDRLTKRLRFASMSKAAYAALSPEDRDILDAYVQGVNTALSQRRPAQLHEFVLLRTVPDLWEPWFPLAIERLFAWLAAELPHPDSLRNAPTTLRTLHEENRLLKEWLHLHGFDRSMAWAITDSLGTHLAQRHVYGASALPLFQEVKMTYPEETAMGATWIGTPFMPAGHTSARSWAVLPASTVSLHPSTEDAPAPTYEYEKWTIADGQEVVMRFRRDRGAFFLAPDSLLSAADFSRDMRETQDSTTTVLFLTWPGWEPVSDAAAWFGLLSGSDAPFALQDGDGLVISRNDSVYITGTPLFVTRHAGVTATSNNPWSALAAKRLTELATSEPGSMGNPAGTRDLRSTWAANITPRLIDTISADGADTYPALVADALTYLRNWEYTFDEASIPATIMDTWASLYFDSTGMWPAIWPDSTASGRSGPGEHDIEHRIMERTVTHLAAQFGIEPEKWRWEKAQPHRYYFPVWSAGDLSVEKTGNAAATRYAPILIPGSGHVTTLQYGTSLSDREPPAPARWEAWTSTSAWNAFRYRARRFSVNRPLAKYLVPESAPEPAVLRVDMLNEEREEPIRYVTILLPE